MFAAEDPVRIAEQAWYTGRPLSRTETKAFLSAVTSTFFVAALDRATAVGRLRHLEHAAYNPDLRATIFADDLRPSPIQDRAGALEECRRRIATLGTLASCDLNAVLIDHASKVFASAFAVRRHRLSSADLDEVTNEAIAELLEYVRDRSEPIELDLLLQKIVESVSNQFRPDRRVGTHRADSFSDSTAYQPRAGASLSIAETPEEVATQQAAEIGFQEAVRDEVELLLGEVDEGRQHARTRYRLRTYYNALHVYLTQSTTSTRSERLLWHLGCSIYDWLWTPYGRGQRTLIASALRKFNADAIARGSSDVHTITKDLTPFRKRLVARFQNRPGLEAVCVLLAWEPPRRSQSEGGLATPSGGRAIKGLAAGAALLALTTGLWHLLRPDASDLHPSGRQSLVPQGKVGGAASASSMVDTLDFEVHAARATLFSLTPRLPSLSVEDIAPTTVSVMDESIGSPEGRTLWCINTSSDAEVPCFWSKSTCESALDAPGTTLRADESLETTDHCIPSGAPMGSPDATEIQGCACTASVPEPGMDLVLRDRKPTMSAKLNPVADQPFYRFLVDCTCTFVRTDGTNGLINPLYTMAWETAIDESVSARRSPWARDGTGHAAFFVAADVATPIRFIAASMTEMVFMQLYPGFAKYDGLQGGLAIAAVRALPDDLYAPVSLLLEDDDVVVLPNLLFVHESPSRFRALDRSGSEIEVLLAPDGKTWETWWLGVCEAPVSLLASEL